MTVLPQFRILPYVLSEKKELKLGESAIFDLMPIEGEFYEVHSIKVAAFSGWDGPLLPLSHGLWLHSLLKIKFYNKPFTEAPLFRFADRQLYPTEFRSTLGELTFQILGQEPCTCEIETHESNEDKTRYTLMLVIDMQRAMVPQ